MGRKFELRTNNSFLKYLFKNPTLNARKTRCLEFVNEYDFNIEHIKGKENKVVDALSRRVHEMKSIAISMYCSNLKSIILENIKSYQHYAQVTEGLQ
jgi:hypothetical protein